MISDIVRDIKNTFVTPSILLLRDNTRSAKMFMGNEMHASADQVSDERIGKTSMMASTL